MKKSILVITLLLQSIAWSQSQPSVARTWVDIMLQMVREDGQGPTIHARNFFHATGAMYDAWAAYDAKQPNYFLGKTKRNIEIPFNPNFKIVSKNIDSLRHIAISYAFFRVMKYRYEDYGSKGRSMDYLTEQFSAFGYDIDNHDTDYINGSPEALGNYIAEQIIALGQQDGSNEEDRHELMNYEPVNPNLFPEQPGVGKLKNPNRWQPIDIVPYITKKGNDKTLKDWNYLLIPGNTQFLTPFWGEVLPFALPKNQSQKPVHLDPGPPPHFNPNNEKETEAYRWGFSIVQNFASKLDPTKTKLWDVSPRGITSMKGHIPSSLDEYKNYYEKVRTNQRKPFSKNPITKKPYAKNKVKQGDYCRVIAEFWVDGPNTSSPPGHWLEFLNKVSYHKDFKRKWNGKGPSLPQLEWDIKSYFLACGTMHDAAIACWSAKGYYDYVRPITAIRYLAGLGQSSNPELPNYNKNGLQLQKGLVELVKENDPLVGANKEHLHKIKLYNWKGPDAINNPFTDVAGVDWILAENWWPYQRYTFATPPFAGYISGHSTFSTASAVLLTYITGSPYFPNGLETFTAKKNEFLGFEDGPSETITLQWATFFDAAIETCLSRVWGGIHPPADDIEGRRVGKKVAENSIKFSKEFFKN